LEGLLSDADLHENPLVPNQKLRQMYVAMVEARVLDEHIAELKTIDKTQRRLYATRGEEACRVGTAIDLEPADLVSDCQAGVSMDLLAGAKVDSLLRRVNDKAAGLKQAGDQCSRQLPWIKDTSERLRLVMGVALSFKTLKHANIVVAYVRQGEVGKGEWRRILGVASQLELPIFFVVLPINPVRKKKDAVTGLSARAQSCGVPGIVVDANDAVALYRVAQETLGRIRGGGGPVLVECRAYALEGVPVTDPVLQMKGFLLGRKVATKAWLEVAGDGIRRRIAAAKL
jgi:TPP-dependent pyruvate/acetoin dehydrogenase alpha subunit